MALHGGKRMNGEAQTHSLPPPKIHLSVVTYHRYVMGAPPQKKFFTVPKTQK